MQGIFDEKISSILSLISGGRIDSFKDFIFKPVGRRILILIIILISAITYQICQARADWRRKHLSAEVVTLCFECSKYEKRALTIPIEKARCTQCGGRIGEAWRCLDCKKDFPFIMPKDTAKQNGDKFKSMNSVRKAYRCPHCNSENTESIYYGNR